MYIGVICACIPALHKMIRHHFPGLGNVWSLLTTHLRGHSSTNPRSWSRPFIHEESRTHKTSSAERQADKAEGPYYNLKEAASVDSNGTDAVENELSHLKSVHSFVRAGSRDPIDTDERIYVTREVHMKPIRP
jgi:hypothetical protein